MKQNILTNGRIQITFQQDGAYQEHIAVRRGDQWEAALTSAPFATLPADERYFNRFGLTGTESFILTESDCARTVLEHPEHTVERSLRLDPNGDAVHVEVCLRAKVPLRLRSVEDLWHFQPPRRDDDNEITGPLDFVWSQRIKSHPTSIVSHYSFRSPMVLFQQGEVFTGMVAGLENVDQDTLTRSPLGMDLDVTRDRQPWMSYGAIVPEKGMPNFPCDIGHAQLVRASGEKNCRIQLEIGDSLSYRYTLLVSLQPEKLGYRAALRYLWQRYGTREMNRPENKPICNRYPDTATITDWEQKIWQGIADKDYFSYAKDGVMVGGIPGRRQGEWFSRTNNNHDLWYGSWLNELVSGYGLSLYARKTDDGIWPQRVESMLNAILSAPRSGALFPVICYWETDGSETWLNDDGWAGFFEEYHTLMMSWTGYLMLLWGQHVLPERMPEVLEFLAPYTLFLRRVQHADGCIPSWFYPDETPSRKQFRDFNAETAVSALLLMEYGAVTGEDDVIRAGQTALRFITDQVLPRMRWFDLETFLSCSRKAFAMYDSMTAQYPQCNLSQMHAAMAYLKNYRLTRKPEDLEMAERVADYLCLSQQVWNHPELTVNTFGGFCVQNTDNDWSDVREGIIAILLHQLYLETGKREYMERAVAAAKAGFAVLPYENWAHNGYEGLQYDSSILWGGGVVLSAAEYLQEQIGDLFVDAGECWGIGTHGVLVEAVEADGDAVRVTVDSSSFQSGLALTIRAVEKDNIRLWLNGIDCGMIAANEKITVQH